MLKNKVEIRPRLQELAQTLPKRSQDAHKGICGRVGVIAGSTYMLGAAVLCARAALRAGAGLVYLFTVDIAALSIAIEYPELIVVPLPTKEGYLSNKSIPIIQKVIQEKKINSIAVGPGLGIHKNTKLLVHAMLSFCYEKHIPAVVDADALTMLTEADLCRFASATQFVLTPHLGEFEKLFGYKPEDEKNRVLDSRRVTSKIKQVVVLKGHQSIVSSPDYHVINASGNEGMATAGTGDVLSGVISGLIAQGLPVYDAAVLGTYIHGRAGDLARDQLSIYSVIASDLIAFLGNVFQELVAVG